MSHFKVAQEDETIDNNEKCTFTSLFRKISDANFVLDYGSMYDALQEQSELSI